MRKRKGFQEVALSLTEPGHMLLAGESTPPLPNSKREAQTDSKTTSEATVTPSGVAADDPGSSTTSPTPRRAPQEDSPKPGKRSSAQMPINMKPRVAACIEMDRSSMTDSTSTMKDVDTESLEFETQTELLSVISTPARVFLNTAGSKHKRPVMNKSGATVDLRLGLELTFMDRVDGWEKALKAAMQLDAEGDVQGALTAYGKLNRQVTKDAIYEYEKMNYDQKKLMNNVMNCLDQRILVLQSSLRGSRPNSISSTFSTGTMSTQLVQSANSATQTVQIPPAISDISYIQLEDCLKYFPTVKILASKHKVPVKLYFVERTRRTFHRHPDKGKSNQIKFPKEKRDFLQFMGLPGKMITTNGLDFTVRPEVDNAGIRITYSAHRSRSGSRESSAKDDDNKENNGSVMETVIDSVHKLSVSDDENSAAKPKRRLSAIILKKPSVSPEPRDKSGRSVKSSAKKNRGKRKDKNEPPEDAEIRSMLSCDSCSSSDEYEESDVCEQDVAVPSNYVHQENLEEGPFEGLDLTYITFEVEKISVQRAKSLVSPFLRLTIRDQDGDLLDGCPVQETPILENMSRNTLLVMKPIYLSLALEALPADCSVFMELVHHRAHLNCLSTHCYTFLEKDDIKTGDFICELYSPPVDYSRQVIHPYTAKAFFLYMKVAVGTGTPDGSTQGSSYNLDPAELAAGLTCDELVTYEDCTSLAP